MIGVELEWPDVDPTTPLPPGWSWSRTDYTIVNSDGTANDPLRKLPVLGGELNSPPYDRPEDIRAVVEELRARMRPGHNYRSNLHVHISRDWTLQDLKLLASFTREYLPLLLPRIDPLEGLLDGSAEAHARYQHSTRSRHYFTTDARHSQRMRAGTLEEFLAAECPVSKQGKVQWHLASREAVNFRSLRKHGTVEFRHFADPTTTDGLVAAMEFADAWVDHALLGIDPTGLVDRLEHRLPRQVRFDARLEAGWQRTNLQKNKRHDVERLLEVL